MLDLLHSRASVITKWESFFVLQSGASGITKWSRSYKVGKFLL